MWQHVEFPAQLRAMLNNCNFKCKTHTPTHSRANSGERNKAHSCVVLLHCPWICVRVCVAAKWTRSCRKNSQTLTCPSAIPHFLQCIYVYIPSRYCVCVGGICFVRCACRSARLCRVAMVNPCEQPHASIVANRQQPAVYLRVTCYRSFVLPLYIVQTFVGISGLMCSIFRWHWIIRLFTLNFALICWRHQQN